MKTIFNISIYVIIIMFISIAGIIIALWPFEKRGKANLAGNRAVVLTAEISVNRSMDNKIPVKTEKISAPVESSMKQADIVFSDGTDETVTKFKTDFSSNEEIKKEYGRLETVELYNGEKYLGAVVSVDDEYTMITLAGVKKISMDKVKSRIIHR